MPHERTKPRTVNSIRCVAHLLYEWDHQLPVDAHKGFAVSPAGNINRTGELCGTYADIFTPKESQFTASLEPGVRPLVTAITGAGFVTYTSCEGHRYDASSSECHVGLLPRGTPELRLLLRALRMCAVGVNPYLQVCRAAVYPWYLYDESNARCVPVVDLYLHQRPCIDLCNYFRHRSEDVLRVAAFAQKIFPSALAAPYDHAARYD
ncbi:MAG: hypothetical protein ACK4OE_08510 [Acidovorax sp.]|uniref:hypothetical protein n=1 Tax=Acidovorax sp. TaxID=1872122 RepID=UPI00391DB834